MMRFRLVPYYSLDEFRNVFHWMFSRWSLVAPWIFKNSEDEVLCQIYGFLFFGIGFEIGFDVDPSSVKLAMM